MSEPLARDEDRAADVEAEGVVLEGRPVPVAHQEADQAGIGVVDLVPAAGEADAGGVDDREVVGHRGVEPNEAVVEDADRARSGITSVVTAIGESRLARHRTEALWVGIVGLVVPLLATGLLSGRRAAEEFLSFYAELLPSVELNSTGYRLPSEEQFERWAEQVPDGFRFAVKMPPRALRSLGTFEERVRRLGDRLGPVRVVVESLATTASWRCCSARRTSGSRSTSATRAGRRRGRSGGACERLGGRCAVSLPPLPRTALLRGGALELAERIRQLLGGRNRRVRLLPARGRADAPRYATQLLSRNRA